MSGWNFANWSNVRLRQRVSAQCLISFISSAVIAKSVSNSLYCVGQLWEDILFLMQCAPIIFLRALRTQAMSQSIF
jgi:hypothetical protein